MSAGPGGLGQRAVSIAALTVPVALLGVSGGWIDVALGVAGCGAGAALRWVRGIGGGGAAALPPLIALVVLTVIVPPTFVDALLAAIAGLGLLLWVGADGRTMASTTDRLGGLALPGFAAFLALATSLATRGVPPSFGIAVAGGILVAVLVAAAVLLSRPPAPEPAPSSS